MNTMQDTSGIDEEMVYRADDAPRAAALHGIVGQSVALLRVLRLVVGRLAHLDR